MSSRVLRKLQGRDELQSLAALAASSSEEEDTTQDDVPQTSGMSANLFSVLKESNSEDDGENVNAQVEPTTNGEVSVKPKKTKKRPRNKKKKSTNKPDEKDELDDIEKVLREVEKMDSNSTNNGTRNKKSNSKKPKYILSVEHRLLNPDNELRKIFGARTLMGDANFRHRNQAKVARGTWLTAPTPSWPKISKTGLTMACTENSQKYQYFSFEYNKEYLETQFKFLDAVDTSDHNQVAMILKENNYHVDTLLALSDVCRINEDSQMARELLERALYSMERSFHSQFNLTTGTCRLPYKRQENRALFLGLYRHIHYVFQRGCGRTALELSKVLLNLDPDDDPLCVLLFIDFFSLQAAEYEFLIQFFAEWEMHKNLSQLPNFAYSVAMSHYEVAESESKDYALADKMLQEALIKFPSVLMLLLEKCSIQPDERISSHKFFTTEAHQTSPDGLQLLCNMFVARNHLLWKSTDVMSWVERNVNAVLDRVDANEPYVNKCRQKRKKYLKPPLNIYRYALVSELPGVISLLPPDIRLTQVLSHDPLPPPDTIVSYTRPERSRRRRNDNPLGLFFQSLMPQFDPDEEPPMQAGAVGGNADLRDRVRNLMDAMRDMLGNFNIPENEEEEHEFQEDEWD